MRKTKIICTIGPASSSEEVLTQMCEAGMNVARLNFSHGDHEEQLGKIKVINKVRDKMGLPIAIMLDTKGPEYRIGVFKDHKATLEEGQEFTFTVDDIVGDNQKVSVSYKGFAQDLKKGDTILVNNGLVICEVTKVKGNDVITKVIAGGTLSDKKSMNFPGKVLKQAYLSDQDKADLLFGIEHDIDYVAASFVSTRQDAQDLRDFLDKNGGRDIDIIAKIENRSGVENIEEISEVVDGIMVARGDLGVEIPFVKLPAVQKELISKARALGKSVVTATEMLESMISNPRPTRAEISDVANAVYDGTSAIMLSGESAQGKFPVQAVATMAEIAETTENDINYEGRFHKEDIAVINTADAVCHSTCSMAIDVNAKAIVACTMSGYTAKRVSRFRCPVDVIAMTTDKKVWRRLALSWGVTPILVDKYKALDVMFARAVERTQDMLGLNKGDLIVLTGGPINGSVGNTNTIKVETIQ